MSLMTDSPPLSPCSSPGSPVIGCPDVNARRLSFDRSTLLTSTQSLNVTDESDHVTVAHRPRLSLVCCSARLAGGDLTDSFSATLTTNVHKSDKWGNMTKRASCLAPGSGMDNSVIPLREHCYSQCGRDSLERNILRVCQATDLLKSTKDMKLSAKTALLTPKAYSCQPAEEAHRSVLSTLFELQRVVCGHNFAHDSSVHQLSQQFAARIQNQLLHLVARVGFLPLPTADAATFVSSDVPFSELSSSQHCLHVSLSINVAVVHLLERLSSQLERCAASVSAVSVPWLCDQPAQLWLYVAHRLIWQLMRRTAYRCHQLKLLGSSSAAALSNASAFSCSCEKGVWLMLLQIFLEKKLNFWQQLNPLFEYLISESNTPTTDLQDSNSVGDKSVTSESISAVPGWRFDAASCWPGDPCVWIPWLMLSVSDLFLYDSRWVYLDSERRSVPDNYPLLLNLLQNQLIEGGSSVTTAASSLLKLSCRLSSDYWGCCDSLLQLIWERLWNQLTTTEQHVPLTLMQLAAAVPKDSRRWLALCRHMPDGDLSLSSTAAPTASPVTSLVTHFCWLLRAQFGSCNKVSSATDKARCWRSVASRIFLRVHARRAAELNVIALVDVFTVILTAVDLHLGERVEGRLVSLLSQLAQHERPNISALIVRVFMTLINILIFEQRRYADDFGAVAAVASIADRSMRAAATEKRIWRGMSAYFDECDALFERCMNLTDSGIRGVDCDSLASSCAGTLLSLVTDGWYVWVLACGRAECVRCLAVLGHAARLTATFTVRSSPHRNRMRPLVSVVQQLASLTSYMPHQQKQHSSLQHGKTPPNFESMSDRSEQLVQPPTELTQLAVWLTLIPETQCLPRAMCSDATHPVFSADYLHQLLLDSFDHLLPSGCRGSFAVSSLASVYDGTRSAILSDYHQWLIHEWFRCFVLSPPGGSGNDSVERFTRVLSQLSPMDRLIVCPKDFSINTHTLIVQFIANLKQLVEEGGSVGLEYMNQCIGSLEYLRAWVRSSSTKSVNMVTHVYRVFSLLVRELVGLLEHQRCVLIINVLLLPTSVYDRTLVLARADVSAVASTLPIFMSGFDVALYQPTNALKSSGITGAERNFYTRCVRDSITCYFHRFPVEDGDGKLHPLIKLLTIESSVSCRFKQLLLQQCNTVLLQTKSSCQMNDIAMYARLLLTVVSNKKQTQGKDIICRLIAAECATPLLNCLIVIQEPSAKRAVTNVIAALVDGRGTAINSAPNSSGPAHYLSSSAQSSIDSSLNLVSVTDSLTSAVSILAEKHLAFSSVATMRVLQVMCVLAPQLMRTQVGALQAIVERIEIKRGVGRDNNLRRGMTQIRQRLGLD